MQQDMIYQYRLHNDQSQLMSMRKIYEFRKRNYL